MTWDGVVTNKSRGIGITESVEAYIQTIVLKATLESISFSHRRGTCQDDAEGITVRLSPGQEGAGIPSDYPGQAVQV